MSVDHAYRQDSIRHVRPSQKTILPGIAAVELDLSDSKPEGLNPKIRLINHRGQATTQPPP